MRSLYKVTTAKAPEWIARPLNCATGDGLMSVHH